MPLGQQPLGRPVGARGKRRVAVHDPGRDVLPRGLGAQIAQPVLMPIFGIWQSMGVLALMYAGGSLLLKWRTKKKVDLWWMCRALTIPSLAGALFALASLPVHHPRGDEEIIDVMTGREGVVVTTRSKKKDLRVVLNNT